MLLPARADSVHVCLGEALQPLAFSVYGSTFPPHLISKVVLVVHLEARLRNQSVRRLGVDPADVSRLRLEGLPLPADITVSVDAVNPPLRVLNMNLAGRVLPSAVVQRSMVRVVSTLSPS